MRSKISTRRQPPVHPASQRCVPLMQSLEPRALLAGIPAGWSAVAYNGAPAGTADETNGIYTVATGPGGNDNSAGYYLYRTFTGNFDFRARLVSTSNGQYGTASLMVRDSLAYSSQEADHAITLDTNPTGPGWYRLARYGDVVTRYTSADNGQTWTPMQREGVDSAGGTLAQAPASLMLGFFVGNNSAVFDNVSVTAAPVLPYTTSWAGQTYGTPDHSMLYQVKSMAYNAVDDTVWIATTSSEQIKPMQRFDANGRRLNVFGDPGAKATIVDGSGRLYYAWGSGITRAAGIFQWDQWPKVTLPDSGSTLAMAVSDSRNELYVLDQRNHKIVVYDTATWSSASVPKTTWNVPASLTEVSASVGASAQMTVDSRGNLWVLQPFTLDTDGRFNAAGKVLCYSPTGTKLSSEITSVPMAGSITYDKARDRLLVADHGTDLQIKAFGDLTATEPTQTGTIGDRYGVLGGAVPGQVGGMKMLWVHNMAMDATGNNLYVTMMSSDLHVWERANELTRFTFANGQWTRSWEVIGHAFVDGGNIDPGDETSLYQQQTRYRIDYSKAAGRDVTYAAYTLDPFAFPEDARAQLMSMEGVFGVRGPNGTKLLYLTDSGQNFLAAYRFDTAHGEIAIPAYVYGNRYHANWSPYIPGSVGNDRRWTWRDGDGDGQMDANEFTDLGPTGSWFAARPATNGDFFTSQGTTFFQNELTGIDANGVPIFTEVARSIPAETLIRRTPGFRYDPANDTMYLAGQTLQNGDAVGFQVREVERYTNWSTAPTFAGRIVMPFDYAWGNPGGFIKSITEVDAVGAFVFAAQGKPGYIQVFDAQLGNWVATIKPGPEVGWIGGDFDFKAATIHAYQRSNGEYVLVAEEDGYCKVFVYRWTPPVAIAAPTLAPNVQVNGHGRLAIASDQLVGRLDGYNIYRATSQNGTYTKINATPVTSLSFVDPNPLPQGGWYRVSFVNTAGEGPQSASVADGFGVIALPVNFTSDAGTGINASKIYTHRVDFGATSGTTINGVSFTGVASPYNGSNITGANFSVVGVGNVGGFTNLSGNTANIGATGNIATLLSRAIDGYGALSEITITLTGLTAGTVYDFRLYYRPWVIGGNGIRTVNLNFNPSGSGIGDTTLIAQDGAAVPTASYLSYTYLARSTSLVAKFSSSDANWLLYGMSNEVASSLPTAPAAPTALNGTPASSAQINLSWTDNSSDETGFVIDRATNSTFTTNLVTNNIGANATTYQATGLTASTTYYFRVRATNAGGESGNSNVFTATTSQAVAFYSQTFDSLTNGNLSGQAGFAGPNPSGSTVTVEAGGLSPTSPASFAGGAKNVRVSNLGGGNKNVFYNTFSPQSGTIYFSLALSWTGLDNDEVLGFFLTNNEAGTGVSILNSVGVYLNGATGYGARVRAGTSADTTTNHTGLNPPEALSMSTPDFIVGSVSKSGANNGHYDTVKVWVNPTSLTEQAPTITAIRDIGNALDLTTFYMFVGSTSDTADVVLVDNIHIGTTYAQVVSTQTSLPAAPTALNESVGASGTATTMVTNGATSLANRNHRIPATQELPRIGRVHSADHHLIRENLASLDHVSNVKRDRAGFLTYGFANSTDVTRAVAFDGSDARTIAPLVKFSTTTAWKGVFSSELLRDRDDTFLGQEVTIFE